MPSPEWAVAALALVGAVVVGVAAHELSHMLALRLAGVACTMSFLPGRDGSGRFRVGVRGPLAQVTPTRLPERLPPWRLRVAAMMPLCLASPFALVPVGVVPDPFAVGNPSLELAAIVWLGCSLPSPRDFSLLWHPRRAIDAHRGAKPGEE